MGTGRPWKIAVRHQAYEKLPQDRHSVVAIAGADIAAILVKSRLGTPEAVNIAPSRHIPANRIDNRLPIR
jgi:hypothetical protein